MSQGESHSLLSGIVGTDQSQQQSGTAGGFLSKLVPYVWRGTDSGTFAAVFGVAMLMRTIQAFLKGERLGTGMHALMAAFWIVVAAVQRRSTREEVR